jgi:hypothetical protein
MEGEEGNSEGLVDLETSPGTKERVELVQREVEVEAVAWDHVRERRVDMGDEISSQSHDTDNE